jgi:hypothetical protein
LNIIFSRHDIAEKYLIWPQTTIITLSSTNKTDCHDITEILLKVALTTINQPNQPKHIIMYSVITWNIIFSRHDIAEKYLIWPQTTIITQS